MGELGVEAHIRKLFKDAQTSPYGFWEPLSRLEKDVEAVVGAWQQHLQDHIQKIFLNDVYVKRKGYEITLHIEAVNILEKKILKVLGGAEP